MEEACRAAGFIDPRENGGSFLTSWPNTIGHGEPLNVILSANSDPTVLQDTLQHGGFQNLMLSVHMAREFLGFHRGAPQLANLGDRQGRVDQLRLLRYDYRTPILGTGFQTLAGGNHLRCWIQKTTGAYFLGVSAEENLARRHDITPNGYNVGRDKFVGDLVGQKIDTATVEAGDRFEGDTSSAGWTYRTVAVYVSGLLEKTSEGINHAEKVACGGHAIDGLVAVLTVSIVKRGQ